MQLQSQQWPDEIRKVYVLCHPDHESGRYEQLLRNLLDTGIPKERIVISAPTWGSSLSPDECFAVYDPFLKRGSLPTFTFKGAGLSRAEISLALNFYTAIQSAADLSGGAVITLESDAWLRSDFVPRLRDLMADLIGKRWDYVSLGEGVGTRPPEAPASYYATTKAWKPPHKSVFRCTDSMMFTVEFLKKLKDTFVPFKEIIDWELNFQMMLHGGTALWADPPLAEQGSWNSRTHCSLY